MLDNDGGVIVEHHVGRSDDLQVLVLQDHLVVVLLSSQVEAGVGQVGVLPSWVRLNKLTYMDRNLSDCRLFQ